MKRSSQPKPAQFSLYQEAGTRKFRFKDTWYAYLSDIRFSFGLKHALLTRSQFDIGSKTHGLPLFITTRDFKARHNVVLGTHIAYSV